MQQGNRKPRKKKVSFANHAMVLDFQKEDPTEKIQFNINAHAQIEEALSGSYLQDSSLSNHNQPVDSSQSYYDHHPPPRHRSYSYASTNSNDDDFLANTFASAPQPQPQHYNRGAFHLSPNPQHQPMDMDIEQDHAPHHPMNMEQEEEEDDDDEMELTGTYSVSQPQQQQRAPPVPPTPQIQGLNDLYDNDDDTQTVDYNPAAPAAVEETHGAESLQDLFNNDDDTKTITNCIPPEIIMPPNESNSFNAATQHLQINAEDNKQSSNVFAATNDENSVDNKPQSMDESLSENANNGSFSDNNTRNTQIMHMPALESPVKERTQEVDYNDTEEVNYNDDDNHNNSSFFASSPTHEMRLDPFAIADDDCTLRVHLPQHLMSTPQKEAARVKTKRRSSTNLTQHIMPVAHFATDAANGPSSEMNASLLSDTTTNIGSVTRKFRTKVIVNNINRNEDAEEVNEANDAEGEAMDTSFNTLLHNVGELLHEQYGLVQQNNDDVNANEIRQAAPDRAQVRNEQQEHEYAMDLNEVEENEEDKEMNVNEDNGDNVNEVEEEEEETEIKWRDIATQYEWFEVSKKPLKYSLGLGISEQNTHLNRALTDRTEIILQEMCDKIELNELQKFSETMNDNAVRIDNEIVDLEKKMDEMNDVTKQNITKYGMNQDAQRLAEYFKIKYQNEFDEAKLKCLTNINDQMNINYEKLSQDLEKLNKVYNDLDNKCVGLQNNISALKQCETNQHLRNLQQKIFANDKQIQMEQARKEKYNELIAYEKNKTHHLENNIAEKTERIKYLKEEIERGAKYEDECRELEAEIGCFQSWTGMQLNRMTTKEIELIICKQVLFSMEYDAKTQKIFNIQFTKHPKPKYTDAVTKYLIDMVYEIGNVLRIKEKVKTISDLKGIMWDMVELITGITEIRRNINHIEKVMKKYGNYKTIIKPLGAKPSGGQWHLKVAIKGDVEYSNHNNEMRKTSLLIQTVFEMKMGHPHNKLNPRIGVVLMRQIFDKNAQKYKTERDRVSQMLIEQELCKLFEDKLTKIKLGRHVLVRCVNLIKYHMDEVLTNETNSKQ